MMEIASLRTLRIDKLGDSSYIVTLAKGYPAESVSCKTAGEMVGLILRDLLPYGRDDEWYDEAGMIADIASGSIDKLIAERLGEDV